jgi:activating signal cointegrator 1
MSVALSLTQPWATLVVSGAKRIETRSWKTPRRGRIAIHASKGFPMWARDLCCEEPFASALMAAGIMSSRDLPLGAILGSVEIVDCVPTDGGQLDLDATGPLDDISDVERAFGDYGPGRYAWLLDSPTRHKPKRCGGALNLWNVETALELQRIRDHGSRGRRG